MKKNRREFLRTNSVLALGWATSRRFIHGIGLERRSVFSQPPTASPRFLFGASVYPELQSREDWLRMLDRFGDAKFTALRVAESSWGNLQTGKDAFEFGWLHEALEDVRARGMSAILGTSTFIAPQWLIASHSDMLRQLEPGVSVHPFGRKAACINHPLYREACRAYISALAMNFGNHPSVVGWQLDNEIETTMSQVCYNAACETAWTRWLKRTYGTVEELNRRWDLKSWGMRVDTFEEIPQGYQSVDPPGIRQIPLLALANLHFQRDMIFEFFEEQKTALRESGATQWITTDLNDVWASLADDPRVSGSLDIEGLNYYPGAHSSADYWKNTAWQHDLHRTGSGGNKFFITETTAGVYGDTVIASAAPTRDQFRMWALQPIAFGASGLLYWSGNRWRGGSWPYWGSLMDWSGKAEIELRWAKELGELLKHWGQRMIEVEVEHHIAVINDFDQRATLAAYPGVSSSQSIVTDSFHCGHRLGLGVNNVNTLRARDVKVLLEHSFVVVAANCSLTDPNVESALIKYARHGGHVLVTPLNSYQSWDGIFVEGGLGSGLRELTGTVVEATRRTALMPLDGSAKPLSKPIHSANGTSTEIGLEGFWEKLAVDADVEIVEIFSASDASLDGMPSITRKSIGSGSVVKLAFWPAEDDALRIFQQMCAAKTHPMLASSLPSVVQGVPRTDGSLFLVNTSTTKQSVSLLRRSRDRLSGAVVEANLQLAPFAVLWLEHMDSEHSSV